LGAVLGSEKLLVAAISLDMVSKAYVYRNRESASTPALAEGLSYLEDGKLECRLVYIRELISHEVFEDYLSFVGCHLGQGLSIWERKSSKDGMESAKAKRRA
jgi:hypothetical protein